MSLATTDLVEETIIEPLTPREREVVRLLAHGTISTARLTDALCIGEPTLHYHMNNIMRKLDVHSRAEVVVHAWKHGLAS